MAVDPTPAPGPEPGPQAARPPLAAYDAESLARCRRGTAAYCLTAGILLLTFGALDRTRFPDAMGALLLVRGAGAAALGVLLALLRTPLGARRPRALGVVAAATLGAIEQLLALAAEGGPQGSTGAGSPINLSTTSAAHREAREREKRYRSVVETAGSVIIVLTPQGSVTEFNREAERVLGWPQAAAVGRDLLTSFVAETSRATVAADVRKALAGEATHAFEAGMLARDGS